MDPERRRKAFERFERATELPMLVLALAIIPLAAITLLADLPAGAQGAMTAAGWMIWAAFALELVVKTYLSEQRLKYLTSHWYDVVIVALPFLRPLRVFRSIRLLRLLRLARLGAILFRSGVNLRIVMGRHGLQYILLGGMLILLACAVLITVLERNNGGPISDFQTALWWAIVTVTTVGYGDAYPTTAAGQGVAVLLMFVGIGLFSVLTANVAALLVHRDENGADDSANLSELVAEVRRLREEMSGLRAHLASAAGAVDRAPEGG